jgi:conjugal transfer pilus assembly protein TraW
MTAATALAKSLKERDAKIFAVIEHEPAETARRWRPKTTAAINAAARAAIGRPLAGSTQGTTGLDKKGASPAAIAQEHGQGPDAGMSLRTQAYKSFVAEASAQLSQFETTSAGRNARDWLRQTIKGVPVIPAGLHGRALQQYFDHTLMQKQELGARTLVFISMSMPNGELRQFFAAVATHPRLLKTVVFVMRGWANKPGGMADAVREVKALMPEKGVKQANVEVNPTLFTSHQIHRVPVLLHKVTGRFASTEDTHNGWAMAIGPTSLRGAIARLDAGKTVRPGPTWKISEPNIITVMEAKIKAMNGAQIERTAASSGWAKMTAHLHFGIPETQQSLDYLFNPSIVLTHTIRLPTGQVIGTKGEIVNPLVKYDQQFGHGWPQVYAVFNARSPWQYQQVEQWSKIYGARLRVMSNDLPRNQGRWMALSHQLGQIIATATPQIVARLGIRAEPALVIGDGDRLRVIVPRVPPTAALARIAGVKAGYPVEQGQGIAR